MKDLLPDDPAEIYKAARNSAAAMWIDRDIVSVSGKDATTYLHGQLSQNIESMELADSVWSFVLQPHGKVDALVRVTRSGDDDYLIDTDPGFGSLVRERLERFKMRSKIDINGTEMSTLAVRGPRAADVVKNCTAVKAVADWPGLDGVDLLGRNIDLPENLLLGDREIYEALRIESGMPRMGQELDERTIPAEAGVNDRAIDFRKGCYTGQELVSRIDARGNNVPRRLRAVVIQGDYTPPLGSPILLSANNEKAIGSLSSAAFSWGLDAPVGLAMVRRDVLPETSAVIDDGGLVTCTIKELPLVP